MATTERSAAVVAFIRGQGVPLTDVGLARMRGRWNAVKDRRRPQPAAPERTEAA